MVPTPSHGLARAARVGLVVLTLINLFNYLDRWIVAALAESMKHSELRLSDTQLGLVLSLFCGFFLYIGASDLLPESHHRHPKALTGLMNIAGATVIWLAIHFAA